MGLTAPRGFSKVFHLISKEILQKPAFYTTKKSQLEDFEVLQIQLDAAKRAKNNKDDKIKKLNEQYNLLIQNQKNNKLWKKILYPVVIILLLALPVISVFLSVTHTIEILFIKKFIPTLQEWEAEIQNARINLRSRFSMKSLKDKLISKMVLGPILNSIESEDENFLNLINLIDIIKHEKAASIIQTFGLIGTFIESILVLYLFASSMIGFYTIPKFSRLKPEKGKTSLKKLIINCILLLSISSALPLLCITLNFVDAQDF